MVCMAKTMGCRAICPAWRVLQRRALSTSCASDPYAILGLSHDATMDEIQARFRELAKQYHPDRNPSGGMLAACFGHTIGCGDTDWIHINGRVAQHVGNTQWACQRCMQCLPYGGQ